jgi:hypothetical protein
MQAPFTFNQVKTKWEYLFSTNAMFGRFLTDEKGERKEGEMLKENNAGEIMFTFRDVRARLPDRKRELIILRPHLMMVLSEEKVKTFLAKKEWEKELASRVDPLNFDFTVYADLVLPIQFENHWVMLVCNYEKREVTIVYFKESTGKKKLHLLDSVCSELWKSGAQGGLRSFAGAYLLEAKFKD